MKYRLTISIVTVFLSLFILKFSTPAFAQSGCESDDWGEPLNGGLTITDDGDFNPPRHHGTDYRAADGDDVRAVADGKIIKIGWNLKQLDKPDGRSGLMKKGWGRYVVIKHGDGSKTLYAHLQKDSTDNLSTGDTVTKGTVIAKSDTSGGATGPHLHLEYAQSGQIFDKPSKTDPDPCFKTTGPKVISVSPPIGKTDETLIVTITGENFSDPAVTSVSFGSGVSIDSFTVNSNTQISVTITISPDANAGPRTINVTNADGDTGELADGFTVKAVPIITSVNPNSDKPGETLTVTITGKNFIAITSLSFGAGITVDSFTVDSETQITVTLSINATAEEGPRTISVTNGEGETGELINGFTVQGAGRMIYVQSVEASDPVWLSPIHSGGCLINFAMLSAEDTFDQVYFYWRLFASAYYTNVSYNLDILGIDPSKISSIDFSGKAGMFGIGYTSACSQYREKFYQTITVQIGSYTWTTTSGESDYPGDIYGERAANISVSIILDNGEQISFVLTDAAVPDHQKTMDQHKTWYCFNYELMVTLESYFSFSSSPVILYNDGLILEPGFTYEISGYSENVTQDYDTGIFECEIDDEPWSYDMTVPAGDKLIVAGPSITKGAIATFNWVFDEDPPDVAQDSPSISTSGYVEWTITDGGPVRTTYTVK